MTENKNDDSLLDNLKAAGASLGGVVSDFADRLREDSSEENLLGRLKDAAGEARTRLQGAQGGEDIKAATADFASTAEDIARQLFGKVSGAASETRDTESYDKVRGFVSDAVSSVRGSVDDAVNSTKAEEVKKDASSRLDDLISNLRGEADSNVVDGEVLHETTTETPKTEGK